MHILITISDQVWGGKHVYVFPVLDAWRNAGHHIIVCAEENGEFLKRAQAAGYDSVPVANFSADNSTTIMQLAQYTGDNPVDLLISTGRRDSLQLYRATQKPETPDIPRIVLRLSAFPITFDAQQEEVYTTVTRLLVCSPHQIEQQFQPLIKKGQLQRSDILVFPVSVDTQRFQPSPPSSRIRDEFDIPPGVPVVGCVARLSWEKDHMTILRAFAKLYQHYPDAILLLVGDGEERAALEEAASNLRIQEAIRFAGDRRDITDLLSVMTIKVLASNCHETGAIALMEAMAMAIPVISSNMGLMPEYIRPNETGWLFEAENADALYDCMKDALKDPDKTATIAQQGRQEIVQHYNQRTRMADYCNFLMTIDTQEQKHTDLTG